MDKDIALQTHSLRGYQEDAVVDVLSDDQNAIIVLATGGGKSHIIQQIIVRDSDHTYGVLINKSALVDQLIDRLTEAGLTVGVLKAGKKYASMLKKDVQYDCYLIMEQSAVKRLDQLGKLGIDVVLRDEVHDGTNDTAERYKEMIDTINPRRIIGLSATPIDQSGICIIHSTRHSTMKNFRLINAGSLMGLTDQGYLAKAVYQLPNVVHIGKFDKAKLQGGEYRTSDLDVVLNTPKHIKYVYDESAPLIEAGRKCMVFANSIDNVELLFAKFELEGIKVGMVHSKLNGEDNAQCIKDYKAGRYQVMINMSMLTIGFDDPKTDCIILVRPTKILRLYLQIVGRGLRTHEGKENCIVLDLCGALVEHGFAESYVNFDCRNEEEYLAKKEENAVPEAQDEVFEGKEITPKLLTEYNLMVKSRDCRSLEVALAAMQVGNTKLSEELAYVSVKYDEATQAIADQQTADTALTTKLTNQRATSDGLRTQLADQQTVSIDLRNKLVDQQTANDKRNTQATQNEHSIAKLRHKLELAEDTDISRGSYLNTLIEQNKVLQSTVDTLKDNLKETAQPQPVRKAPSIFDAPTETATAEIIPLVPEKEMNIAQLEIALANKTSPMGALSTAVLLYKKHPTLGNITEQQYKDFMYKIQTNSQNASLMKSCCTRIKNIYKKRIPLTKIVTFPQFILDEQAAKGSPNML